MLSLALAMIVATTDRAAPAPVPNVVLLFADDLGYGDLGCYGGRNPTPRLDRLAAEGLRFTDFYVAQAVCSASRAALLTGCYPNRIGIAGALGPGSRVGIAPGETTLSELLRSRGYATGIFGKWHLGHREASLPTNHGFDAYFGLPYSNDMWPRHPTQRFPDLPLVEGTAIIARNPDQRGLTEWSTREAVKFIDANRDRPFFLYVPYSMPHVPLHASAAFEGSTGLGLYADVIAELDDSVGRILDALDGHGLRERTLVIFTSDNGPWLSYGDHAGSTGGLREGKGTTFEGGVRVPCVVRWPGVVASGSVCREPAMTIDWLPTIARAAGAESPAGIDGRDITPLLRGEPGATRGAPLLFYWGDELQAVHSGRFKLHFPHEHVTLTGPAGTGGAPGAVGKGRIGKALFDLEADEAESRDVAGEHPGVVAELEAIAEAARADLGDSATGRGGAGVRLPQVFEAE
jgi:arylsulfatase A-like enzyme